MKTERGILKLYFTKEIEGCGTLDAHVAAGFYAGSGYSLFDMVEIEAFAKAISECPLAGSDRCCLKGSRDCTGLNINVYPINSRGHLGVTVCVWATREGLPMKVELELVTTYEALANFSRNLLSAIKGEIEVAVLEEEAVL